MRIWGHFLWGQANWNHIPQAQSYRPFGDDDDDWEEGDVDEEPEDYDDEIGENDDDPDDEITDFWTDTVHVIPEFIDEIEHGIEWV